MKKLLACTLFMSAPSFAQQSHVEEMHVLGEDISGDKTSIAASEEFAVDSATLLKKIPGANVNANGSISGIAQYRGMFGDRVSVSQDGSSIVSGGPNAMDAPLSYVSPLLTKTISIERGIASVSSAAETIGGHINAETDRGDFEQGQDIEFAGVLSSHFNFNGDVRTTAVRLQGANDSHKLALLASLDNGDDLDTPVGTILPSRVDRERFDLSYGYKSDRNELIFYVGQLETADTGTPALAMDIRTIETDMFGAQWNSQISDSLSLSAKLSYNDVEHVMDNFGLRTPPESGMQYRSNLATGEGHDFRLEAVYKLDNADLRFGMDNKVAEHNSVISNPNAAVFEVLNFNQIERDLSGVFVEYSRENERSDFELGLRYNRVSTNAGEVDATMPAMMAMMEAMADGLADQFNAENRDLDFNNLDLVFKYNHKLTSELSATAQLASKTRAPSYQELYLWLPLQASGGLADGRTYVGNLDLDSERSNEINLGLNWLSGDFHISPQIFYKRIDDYIQGVESTNMAVNMLSNMMAGANALQFDNVDAEIFGLDLAWHYRLSETVYLDGLASYIRGERRDAEDNLYRLAPPSATFGVNYLAGELTLRAESALYMEQDDVSTYNGESETAGYGLVNISANWNLIPGLRLEARVDNLFDKTYQDHLAGVNRVMDADIYQGERLFGTERSVSLGFNYQF